MIQSERVPCVRRAGLDVMPVLAENPVFQFFCLEIRNQNIPKSGNLKIWKSENPGSLTSAQLLGCAQTIVANVRYTGDV